MAGLRERKKAAAMRRIQAEAITMFRAHGFGNVTVEQVAEAADTSPSTIYRYFGTKEGLVLHDEYDDVVRETFTELLRAGTPLIEAAGAALAVIADDHFVDDLDETLYRVDLWFGDPSIQAAAAAFLWRVVEEVTAVLVETGRYDAAEARFVATAVVNGYMSSIMSWRAEGATRPIDEYVKRGLAALAGALAESGATRA